MVDGGVCVRVRTTLDLQLISAASESDLSDRYVILSG